MAVAKMLEDLEFVLGQVADESRPVRSIDLSRFSDLPRGEVVRFESTWRGLDAGRRLALVSMMVEQAEANIHLNFHAILRECLNDAAGQIRRLAIEGLWEDEKPSLIGRLVALMANDPEPDVRAAAATSLGRFVLLGALGEITEADADQAERSLRTAWMRMPESNEVRRRVLESLAYAADPAVSALIEAAYDDDDELMRQSAVFAMGRSADRRWSTPILVELRNRDAAMRFEAAVSAGELGLPAAVQPLIQLMDDADNNVREAAALALGKIGGREARRALEAAIDGDDERLAQAAEDALEELVFNSSGFESSQQRSFGRPQGRDRSARQSWDTESRETGDKGLYDEDEDDTGTVPLGPDWRSVSPHSGPDDYETEEDEDAWDAEESEALYWLDEDEDEDEDDDLSPEEGFHVGTDSFPGLPGGWRGGPGPF
jgi:HEAT repeat protein